jgi:hypothetical protein
LVLSYSSPSDVSLAGVSAEHLLQETLQKCRDKQVRISLKSEHALHRWIDRGLRVLTLGKMDSYLTSYVTTIGRSITVPDDWEDWSVASRWEVLEHELVHVAQFERYTFLGMVMLYLFVPLPVGLAYARARLEWEAYAVTLECAAKLKGLEHARSPEVCDRIVDRFCGPDYGWMWPFRSVIRRWIDDKLAQIERDSLG